MRSAPVRCDLRIWRRSKTTGLWTVVRAVTSATAAAWLVIWRREEPDTEFKVSKTKPSSP